MLMPRIAEIGSALVVRIPVGHCFGKPWKIIEGEPSHFPAKRLVSNTNVTPLGSAIDENGR
jgi:hypothetical protein